MNSNNNIFHSNIKPHSIKTIKILEEVKTSDGSKFIPMEKEVCFIRESESSIELYYKNKLVTEYGSTYSDFYGFLSSIQNAIEEAKEAVKKFNINKNSEMEVRVVTTITEIPCLKVPKLDKESNNKDKEYLMIPNNWFIQNKKLESIIKEKPKNQSYNQDWADYRENLNKHKIESQEIIKEKVTYSSKENEKYSELQIDSLKT